VSPPTTRVGYWCELAWLGSLDGRVESGVAITVEGDRIMAVTSGLSKPPTGSVRLAGLTMPGLTNAHSHAFHRGLRGRTHGELGTFWTWREQMYSLADRLAPDAYRALATAAYAEMAMAGFTCVGEFNYLHHGRGGAAYSDPNELSRVLVEAAATAGVRLTLLDTCYLRAGLGEDAVLSPTQQRFSDGSVDAWSARVDAMAVDGVTARLGAAVHSVRSVDASAIGVVAAWARSRDAVLHAHVSEQPAENEQCLAAEGATPTELLAAHGALGPRFSAIHATHLVDRDVELFAESGSICCICPTTERDLADGIGPTASFRAGAIPMTIGTDSHAVVDPFEEIRAIELNHRLASLTRGTHQPGELLTMATAVGADSLGWPEAGRLHVGALADLTTVSLDSVRLAGTDPAHAAAAVVFAATAADVRHVVVGGRVIVADGVHLTVDVGARLAESIREVWA
jgi:formiminoglutamate deiminase